MENEKLIKAKSWKDYMPEYVSLYYVDCRDDLSEQIDILQDCIERNSLYPLSETVYDWWDFPEEQYLDEIHKKMEKDGLEAEYDEHIDDIRDWLSEHDESTPIEDLLGNTNDVLMFYSLGKDIDCGWHEELLCNPWKNESEKSSAYKVRRMLGIKDGTSDAKKILNIVENSYDGGELRIYFTGNIKDFINDEWNGDEKKSDFQTIRFDGEITVAIYNPGSGSGDFCRVKLNKEFSFVRENLRISETESYSLESCFGCYGSDIDSGGSVTLSLEKPKSKSVIAKSKIVSQENKFIKIFKEGGCSADDVNMSRHRNVVYRNDIPCGWHCPHCGREWLD